MHSLKPFLTFVELILPWPWECSLFLLQAFLLEALRLREVAELGGASFLQRVKLVAVALEFSHALLPDLFLVVLL